MTRPVSLNHYSGCLLGGAIGDALGALIEFLSIKEIEKRFGPKGLTNYMEFPEWVGEYTDDTQMTLFTAEGLLRGYHRQVLKGIGGAITSITYQSYIRWLFTQGIDIDSIDFGWGDMDLKNGWLLKQKELHKRRAPGNSCLSSLRQGIPGTIDEPINNSKGCGAVMRMAPVGLMYTDLIAAFNAGCVLGAITHGHPSGYLSAGVFAAIIQQLVEGKSLRDALLASIHHLQVWDGHEEVLRAINKAIDLADKICVEPENKSKAMAIAIPLLGEGWVGEVALAIAVLCSLVFTHNYKGGVLSAVNHSGDSDSTGSITGNILGFVNEIEGISEEWISNLGFSDFVIQVSEDLYTGCKSDSFNTDDEWWEKYPGY